MNFKKHAVKEMKMKSVFAKIKTFIRQETVLAAAVLLAVLSSLMVHPDRQYMDYLDFRTLGILFSLMTIMAGWRQQGVFDRLGQALLNRTKSSLSLVLVLVGLCFAGSMVITNDVALMTFVPFTFAVLSSMDEPIRRRLLLPVVCMQTIAANLGSMLTPIGNPQNLYLYSKSNLTILQFMGLMIPYTAVSMVLLIVWAFWLCRRKQASIFAKAAAKQSSKLHSKKIVVMYAVLFMMCMLSVVHILPYELALAAVLVCAFCANRAALRAVDYSLLLTFTAFFVFIGNLGRIPVFSDWIQHMISGREVPVAVLASQATSNVPAALLLSGFTENTEALIIGTNLGGLGTLIASMASLISYRQIARELPQDKGKYFRLFTISNIVFLMILLAVWYCMSFA